MSKTYGTKVNNENLKLVPRRIQEPVKHLHRTFFAKMLHNGCLTGSLILSVNPTKWSNTLKQPTTNFLSVSDHLWGWRLKILLDSAKCCISNDWFLYGMQHWVEMGEQASVVIRNQLYKDNMTTQGLALFTSNVYFKQTAHIVLTLLNMLLLLKSEARGEVGEGWGGWSIVTL